MNSMGSKVQNVAVVFYFSCILALIMPANAAGLSECPGIFDPNSWENVDEFNFEDITYHRAKNQGTVRIAFNRPECLNSFRPKTVDELFQALDHARQWSDVGCVLITGNGPSKKHNKWSFSAGGDQRIRGKDGYKYEGADKEGGAKAEGSIDDEEVPKLEVGERRRWHIKTTSGKKTEGCTTSQQRGQEAMDKGPVGLLIQSFECM